MIAISQFEQDLWTAVFAMGAVTVIVGVLVVSYVWWRDRDGDE